MGIEQHHPLAAIGGQVLDAGFEQAEAAGHLLLGQRRLDALGGGLGQRQGVPAEGPRFAGNVDDTEDLAVARIVDHRRRAGPALDALAEVLGRMDLHRVAEQQGGADGVGAADLLAPRTARHQVDVFGPAEGRRVAARLEDHPLAVGEDQHGAALRHQLLGHGQRRRAAVQQTPVALAGGEQLRVGQRLGGVLQARIDPPVQAAAPGIVDRMAEQVTRRRRTAQHGLPGRADSRGVFRAGKHPAGHRESHRLSPPFLLLCPLQGSGQPSRSLAAGWQAV
ncbi:hypothetical protein D3C81_1329990 [compost metagenome]